MREPEHRLLEAWLAEEEGEGPRLGDVLERLREESRDLEPLAAYLAVKLEEDRGRVAVQERSRVLRALSWRLVGALFLLGVLGLVVFVAWGGDQAFAAALFFLAGAATYYLIVQTLVTLRGQRDTRELRALLARSRARLPKRS